MKGNTEEKFRLEKVTEKSATDDTMRISELSSLSVRTKFLASNEHTTMRRVDSLQETEDLYWSGIH